MGASAKYALGGGAAIVAFATLPDGGVGQAVVFLGLMALSIGLVGRAVGGLPAGRRRPWLVLLVGEAVYGAASLAWYLLPVGWGVRLPYPSILDGLTILSYALLGAFLVLLGAGGPWRVELGGMTLDALVAAAAAGAVVQVWLVEPAVDTGTGLGFAAAVAIVAPVFTVALAAFAVLLVLRGVLHPGPGLLLTGWAGAELVANAWHAHAELVGSFRYGHPMFTFWLLSYVALGALALHPRLADPFADGSKTPDARLQMLVLGVAVAIPLGLHALYRGPEPSWQHTGRVTWVAVVIGLVLLRALGLVRDLALERRLRADVERLAAQLERVASHDGLTGLATRPVFHEALSRALVQPRRPGRVAALLLLDLHAFRAVNDTYGHAVGDELLRQVAGRSRSLIPEADVLARVGSDEFAAVLDAGDAESVLVLADRLVAGLVEPFVLPDIEITSGVSVGVHVAEPGESVRDVMLRAGAALAAAKAGGGGCERFDSVRHGPLVEWHEIELDLRGAPARGELVLHYQPVVELATRRIVGVEALLRWDHPTRGFLNPGAFIQIAEESGAIVDIGRWVIKQACADARLWQERIAGAEHVGVALNVSRRQLRSPGIVADVADGLRASGLAPASLTVEVTETALMVDTQEMVAVLDQFKALGVEVAMDDFGTGYSSLAQLRTLPIDVLKIDKAFVDGIAREHEEWALAAAIVRLAGSLGKRTLAEGVELASQLAHLRSLGCELAQGFLFARPMPLADLEGLLAGRALAAT